MLTAILMCQQGIPFKVSPARTQMIDELIQRKCKVIIFFPGYVIDKKLKSKAERIINTRGLYKKDIIKKIKKINPNIVICFTVEDTEICYPLPHLMRKTNFYYYNLEIYVPPHKGTSVSTYHQFMNRIDYIQNKLKEIIYVRGCCALVIQDRLRKRILSKYLIYHPNTWLIPNSYYTNHHKHGGEHKGGLIYSGSLGQDVLGSFMDNINEFQDIPITLSGWSKIIDTRVKENSNIKVVVHDLSQEEYTKFISEYDIALIWYSDKQDDNVYNIGLASGKFFKHLSLGQPVIVNNVPGLAKEVRKNKLGVVINDLSELNTAVRTINTNYEFYVQNIKKIYEKRYDYQKVSKDFFDFMVNEAKGII